MSGPGEERGPRYPSREELVTRVTSSSDPVPDDAATTLDSVRFTTDLLAEGGTASPPQRTGAEAVSLQPAVTEPIPATPAAPPAVESPGRGVWIALLAVAVLGGFFGALFGIWLALR